MASPQTIWRSALLIFAVAIVLRAAFLIAVSTTPAFSLLYMDPEYNLEWARGMATGVWNPPYDSLREGPFFRTPLYSMFLAAIWRVFGENLWIFRSFQSILGFFSGVLAFLLAKRLYNHPIGVITGLLCAGYWVLIYFDSQFLFPVLLVFLALAGFIAMIGSLDRKNMTFGTIFGLFFGLFAITRPNILVFFPFLAFWGIWAWPGTIKIGFAAIFTLFWVSFRWILLKKSDLGAKNTVRSVILLIWVFGDLFGLAHLVATKQNRHADAQEALRRAQSINPHHPAVRDMLKTSGMGDNSHHFRYIPRFAPAAFFLKDRIA